MAARTRKPWEEISQKSKKRHAKRIADVLTETAGNSPAALSDLLSRVCRELPEGMCVDTPGAVVRGASLVAELGRVRVLHLRKGIGTIPMRAVDRVVHDSIENPSKGALSSLGYAIGQKSWHRTTVGRDGEILRPRGRPAKTLDAGNVALVKAVVDKYTDDSSRLVSKRLKAGEHKIMPARVLKKPRTTIWMEEPALKNAIGATTFRKALRQLHPDVKNPKRATDYCSHCLCFQKQLLPESEKVFGRTQQLLEEFVPDYFANLPVSRDRDGAAMARMRAQHVRISRNDAAQNPFPGAARPRFPEAGRLNRQNLSEHDKYDFIQLEKARFDQTSGRRRVPASLRDKNLVSFPFWGVGCRHASLRPFDRFSEGREV